MYMYTVLMHMGTLYVCTGPRGSFFPTMTVFCVNCYRGLHTHLRGSRFWEIQACIDITIIDNNILEPVFTVELETFYDFVDIRNRNTATVNIFDNDSKQTLYSNMLHGFIS